MSQAIHDSRRQLVRVWWAVLVAVIATLATAALVYFVAVPHLRPPLAREGAPSR